MRKSFQRVVQEEAPIHHDDEELTVAEDAGFAGH
jgi:hypothetical protein